jgi:Flp pilus assembly protein TadG
VSRRVVRARSERGSLAVEMAIIVPSILLIFGLIFAYGRAASVNGYLESATRDAARAATLARSFAEAEERAEEIVHEATDGLPQACQDSMVVDLIGPFTPGEPITVTTSCSYGLDDIGLPGAPGTISPESSFTSMLDPYRGVE